MNTRKFLRNFGYASSILILLYVLVYGFLSFNGRYEPWSVDINQIKEYQWAPIGYYDAAHPWVGSIAAKKIHATVFGGWNNSFLWNLFYPIYRVDCSLIHKNKAA